MNISKGYFKMVLMNYLTLHSSSFFRPSSPSKYTFFALPFSLNSSPLLSGSYSPSSACSLGIDIIVCLSAGDKNLDCRPNADLFPRFLLYCHWNAIKRMNFMEVQSNRKTRILTWCFNCNMIAMKTHTKKNCRYLWVLIKVLKVSGEVKYCCKENNALLPK